MVPNAGVTSLRATTCSSTGGMAAPVPWALTCSGGCIQNLSLVRCTAQLLLPNQPGNQPGSQPPSSQHTHLDEAADGLLANGGVVLEREAVLAQLVGNSLHPGARLHGDLRQGGTAVSR